MEVWEDVSDGCVPFQLTLVDEHADSGCGECFGQSTERKNGIRIRALRGLNISEPMAEVVDSFAAVGDADGNSRGSSYGTNPLYDRLEYREAIDNGCSFFGPVGS